MKKWFSRMAAIVALTIAMILVGTTSFTTYAAEDDADTVTVADTSDDAVLLGDTAELAGKTVSYKSLGAVTGLSYNKTTGYLTWKKVKNADGYTVKITRTSGTSSYTYSYITSALYYSLSLSSDYTYVISVSAYSNSYYIVAKNVTSDVRYANYTTDSTDTTKTYYQYASYSFNGTSYVYTLYIQPEGAAASISASPAKSESTTAISSAPSIQYKETYVDDYSLYMVFKTKTTPVNLNYDGEYIIWEYSNNSSFVSTSSGTKWKYTTTSYDGSSGEVTLDLTNKAEPGDKIYVRCRVYNPNYSASTTAEKYSSYSKTVGAKISDLRISSVSTYVKATSVTLMVNGTNMDATGYKFQKKVNGKWVTMAKQTSPSYTFTKLTKNKKYSFRVLAYYYNTTTKKTVSSAYYIADAMTWTANLNFKASVNTTNSVKLKWNKVSGISGYEIYRAVSTGNSLTYANGESDSSYTAYTLVAKLKSSKTSYVDKKLTAGKSYTYLIRAYRTINGTKVYIQSTSTANLESDTLSITDEYVNAKGKTVVKWKKMTGITGYYIEKYNATTGGWKVVKKLSASKTGYTFAKVKVGKSAVRYRIRPYKKNKIYDSYTVSVYPTLSTVTGVKVKKTSSGIKISWKAVSGADYYCVYRTTTANFTYDSTTKTYSNNSDYELVYEGNVDTTDCHPELGGSAYISASSYATYKITGTSVVDKALKYTTRYTDSNGDYVSIGTNADGQTVYKTETAYYSGVQGPTKGVKYYYYVVAYATPTSGSVSYSSTSAYSNYTISSIGISKPKGITYTSKKTASKLSTSKISVKSTKKGKVTITMSSKPKTVAAYAIYRSTKKGKGYVLVGITTSKKFTDTSAKSGKTYYYKVAKVTESEAKAYIYGAKSSAKKVKVK